ncbi:hypothetical protein LJR230_000045 [Trinickia sp. LjRoot230]|uniref:hypothetical protein n=1 Tax=Trinickia sp. LjRoot230 TaxID=3342288 RepID=UPI003ECFFDC6
MDCNAETASFDDDKRAPKPVKSALYLSGDIDPVQYNAAVDNEGPFLMADDPRLTPMPAAPTLFDFFRCRFSGISPHIYCKAHAVCA